MCPRCAADPQPSGEDWTFGSPRRCAFNEDGTFTSENWQCATLEELLAHRGDCWTRGPGCPRGTHIHGDDESLDVFPVLDEGESCGWIVLTRYKHRGKTSTATRIDSYESRPLTFADAEIAIVGLAGDDCQRFTERRTG